MSWHSTRLSPALLLALWAGCGRAPQPKPQPGTIPALYRFDDNLASAGTVSAPQAAPSATAVADPVVWKNFRSPQDVTWDLLRGRMGVRNDELIVKGEGSSPVIVSPGTFPIDWSLYEAVRIRMMAEGGREVKIKIGDDEFQQPLAPPRVYKVYRFDLHIESAPRGSRPLAIMPTDSLFALTAISFIELTPRKLAFAGAAGRQFVGKQDEYRNTLYVHSPSTVTFEVPVPPSGRLHFGMGIAEKGRPVTFRLLAGAENTELFAKKVEDPGIWEDADADLSRYANRRVKLVFRTESESSDGVGFWANPRITAGPPRQRPNILLYMIDTLRADHSNLYGYARDTTPFLKKLGDKGLVFDDCHAQATWTKPSVASLLTSIYSFTHGMVNDYDTIPQGATTLAEQLRAAGYVTAGVVSNPFAGKASGLQRGFDYMMEYPVVHRYRTDAADRGTDSAALNKVVMPWLERHKDEPFFLYAHTTDPHAPYRPPAGFEEKFANPAETAEFNRDYARLRDKRQYGGGTVVSRAGCARDGIDPDRFIRRAIDRYDGEILHNDHSLELLAGKLKELGILDNTLIVVVSDHGEEFWEHGWTAHGHSVYQELTHCVFLMWNPKLLPVARRIAEPAQLVDVMPTVLDLLGIQPQGIMEGQSLGPLAKGQPFQRKGPVMSSRFAHPKARPTGFVPENRTDSFAILTSDWKLIYRDKAKAAGLNPVELYDRKNDRTDSANVAAGRPEQAKRMMAEVNQWIDAQKQVKIMLGPRGTTTLDPQTIERLRSLGYLGGAPTK
jgi:arylsulfatase A-like enzyme